MATPLQTVKSKYESKAALVEKLIPMLDRASDENEAEFKERLLLVSNKKLLTLLARETMVREKFGSREGLMDKILENRAVNGKIDAGLRAKVQSLSTGRLIGMYKDV